MSLRPITVVLSLATLLMIGCDANQFDSPDPAVQPPRTETQPPVTDQDYITPDAALPRPESPRQPEYPVGESPTPATSQPPATEQEATPDTDLQADPATPPSPPLGADDPAVEEVPAETPPS